MDVEEIFGLRVEGFDVGVGDGPGGGDAALVVDDAEVLCAKAEHGGTVDLGLASDIVSLLRVERLALLILPDLFGVVAIFEEDGGGIPVELFLREKRAAFKDEDVFACTGEMEGERAASGSSADDDCIAGL